MSNNDSLISSGDVEYVAKLAHLHLDETEKKDMETKLGSILGYMQQLQQIDTTGVEATTHVLPLANVFREDIVGETLDTEKACLLYTSIYLFLMKPIPYGIPDWAE